MPEYKTKEQQRFYDKYIRNKDSKKFYNSATWRRARVKILSRDNHLCQECLRHDILTPANAVHHIKELENYPDLALDEENLESICNACHNKEHPEKGGGKLFKKKNISKKKLKVVKAKSNQEFI